jgi:hypothetical protein
MSRGDSAPHFSEWRKVFPIVVGSPSGETHDMTISSLSEVLRAEVPVLAVVAFFEPFLGLLSGGGGRHDHRVTGVPVRRRGHFKNRLIN